MNRKINETTLRLGLARALWGWVPHETQRRWLACRAKTKVAACGRRWGKTEAAAIDASTTALVRPGSVQIIVSPTYDQSRLIFDTVERLILGSSVTRSMAKVVRTPYPRLTIGKSLIMARTADEDGRNLRGHCADRVIVDEAAYVRDSVIQEVISPMLADRDGELVMISTPFGKNHFYRTYLRGQGKGADRCVSFTFPSWANPHVSREYIEAQRQELSARQFSVEYEAHFLDDQSCVFPWEDIQAAVERGEQSASGGFGSVAVGIDWARYSDYTAVIALGVNEDGCAVTAIDRFNGLRWDQQIGRVTEFLRARRATAALTDQTSIGDPLLEQLCAKACEEGLETSIEGYNFTNASKRELVDHLALQLSHGRLAIPRDEHLIGELQYFEYELTQSGNVRMNARSGHHDDLVMALALACWQAKSVACASGGFLTRNGRVTAVGW